MEKSSNLHVNLRLSFLGALLLVICTGLVSQYCLQRSRDDSAWLSHTNDVLAELQGLSSTVHIAQRDQRDYLLRPDPAVKASRVTASERIQSRLARVRELTVDNPSQQQRLQNLAALLEKSRAIQETDIAAAEKNQQKAASDYAARRPQDEATIGQIEAAFRQMRDEEGRLLKQRAHRSQESSFSASILLGISTSLAACLIAFCACWVMRELRRRKEAETALHHAREGLEQRVQERTAEVSKAMATLKAEIAEHRKTEERLRKSEERYRLLFEDSPLPMEIFDPETLRYLAINKAAQELYGYTQEEFQQMTMRDTRPEEEVPKLLEFLEKVKDTDSYSGTFVTKHKSGNLITIEARVRTIDFDGRRVRLKLVTDVTEHKRMEMQLRQSQKIEAVGRLAGGIAHDFNNLLTVILGYSDSILRSLKENDAAREKVLEIQAAGQRAANLTSQLLAFSRKQILKPQVLELNGVVSSISQMLRRLLGEDIQISMHLDAALGQVQADRTQIEQALVNLAVNARDAMPDGGKLVIESHNVELDDKTAVLQGVPPGRYVVLVVSDTGCGMDDKTKARVFEPFFTTKEVGKGTGLGLSMVLGVVQQSGGTVTIYSEVGIGTTIKVYLPRIDAAVPEASETLETQSVTPVHGATILLVEDEPSLRALAREILREAGYSVVEASNGKEALRAAETFSSPPDLLLTDVVMPEMSGLELSHHLQRKWHNLAVIYTSGYTDHALLERNALRQDMPFLQKPYSPSSLLEQVAAVLQHKRPTVLIVEDDKHVRDQLRSTFEQKGHPVLEAVNGHQAMEQIQAHPVKLVITDLVMPVSDGMEMIQELRRNRPDIKIIAISGAFEGAYLHAASKLGADLVLQKPFEQDQVMHMAEELLV